MRIFIRKEDEEVEGVLQLVDLAGSEHRIDSSEHDAARRKECAQINSSLSALKECIRAHAKGSSFIPFRSLHLFHSLLLLLLLHLPRPLLKMKLLDLQLLLTSPTSTRTQISPPLVI